MKISKMERKIEKMLLVFSIIGFHIPNITKRILVIGSQCFNKDLSEFKYE